MMPVLKDPSDVHSPIRVYELSTSEQTKRTKLASLPSADMPCPDCECNDQCKTTHIQDALHKSQITGIGRNFNRELGQKAFRTACTISLETPLDLAIATIKRKMADALTDPTSTVRLMVQGDEYWYSQASAEEIIATVVNVDRDGQGLARSVRFCDGAGDSAIPAAICVCEPFKGSMRDAAGDVARTEASTVTWLFRHDVIDGWRVLRFLCSLLFDECPLTFERLRQRHQADKLERQRQSVAGKLLRRATGVYRSTLFAPVALARLASLGWPSETAGDRQKFYMHAVVSLTSLKELSRVHGTGGASTTLTACIATAFFAADQTRERAVVGQNILFDPDAPQGNHVCVKMALLTRPRNGDSASMLTSAARTINSSSQGLADLVTGTVTRQYVKGQLTQGLTRAIEKRHEAMDFLVSNLPAFDSSDPRVLDLQTLREFTDWKPCIVYIIGVGDDLFCDFYWEVLPAFSTEAFMAAFTSTTGAKDVHTRLAGAY